MFHNYMLQKCTLLFKTVKVLLHSAFSKSSSIRAQYGQTPICMNKQGVISVFVLLLLRAAFPFLLKKGEEKNN